MSLIYYKFKSAKDYNTITFDGLTISLFELKRDILIDSKLKGADFDIIISNAQSDEDYLDDTQLIPKNTSVYVRRVPAKQGGPNAQLYLSANNSAVNPLIREPEIYIESSSASASVPSLDFGIGLPLSLDGVLPGESENDKLKSLFDQSSMQWGQQPLQTNGYQSGYKNHNGPNRGGNFQGVPSSSTYVCHRCGLKGHYVQNCQATNDKKLLQPKVKRTTGIPRSFLKNVEAIPEGKGAMITSDGSLVVAQTNDNAWKKFQLTQRGSAVSSDIVREKAPVPSKLSCKLCRKLLTSAVSVPCCSDKFCLECITEALLEKSSGQQFVCPSCSTQDIVPDSLIVERALRSKVDEHLRYWAIELEGDLQSNEVDSLFPKENSPESVDASSRTEKQKDVPDIESDEDHEFALCFAQSSSDSRVKDAEFDIYASDSEPSGLDSPKPLQPNIISKTPTLRWTYSGGMSEKPLSPDEVARLNKIPFADCKDIDSRGRSRDRQNITRRNYRPRETKDGDSRSVRSRSSMSPFSDYKRYKTSTNQDHRENRISSSSSRRPASPVCSSRDEMKTLDCRRDKSETSSRSHHRDSSRAHYSPRRSKSPSREHSPNRRRRSDLQSRYSLNRNFSPDRQSSRSGGRSVDSSRETRNEALRRSDTEIYSSFKLKQNPASETRRQDSHRLEKKVPVLSIASNPPARKI